MPGSFLLACNVRELAVSVQSSENASMNGYCEVHCPGVAEGGVAVGSASALAVGQTQDTILLTVQQPRCAAHGSLRGRLRIALGI